MDLLRLPGTYRPQADTWLLADVLHRSGLAAGRRVLDVGTGTGALALAAAAAGARSVTAVDLSARSLATAWLNARRHGVPLQLHRGDLLAPVQHRRFDLVTANPPYVPATAARPPRHRAARAWDAGRDGRALLDRICAGAPRLLAPGGAVLVVQSAVAGTACTVAGLQDAGLRVQTLARVVVPFGPVMRARAQMLRQRGLLDADADAEELVVLAGHAAADHAATDHAAAGSAGADLPAQQHVLPARTAEAEPA